MTKDSDEVYVWRLPNWGVGVFIALGYGPVILAQGYNLYLLWDFDRVRQSLWVLAIVGIAGLTGWLLSRMVSIRIGPDEVRWSLGINALRSEDVERYRIVRRFGVEWVHIQRKRGFPYSQLLNPPGGRELRRRLLEWLGRTGSPR